MEAEIEAQTPAAETVQADPALATLKHLTRTAAVNSRRASYGTDNIVEQRLDRDRKGAEKKSRKD